MVYGTDDGVYISDLRESGRDPVKVLSLLEVSQVDVLEDYQLMIVLSGKHFSLSLSTLKKNCSSFFFFANRTTSDNVSFGCLGSD